MCYRGYAVDLDTGFGNDGRLVIELGAYGDRANAVIVQPDGKIVVGGSSSSGSDLDFMLFRLFSDGSLDPEFNFDGTVTSAVGPADDEILSLELQDDGKIIAAGYSSNGTDRDFALVRYNSDGSLDRNFGREGMVVTSVGNSDDEITGIELDADGSILVTGSATGTAGRIIVLGKYRADGSLDSSFADGGFSFTGVGDEAQAESVAIRPDRRIVVAGSYSEDNRTGLMVVGFGTDGQLDESFAENGVAVPADQDSFSEGYGLALLEDGAILVAGSVGEEGKRAAALFRFTATGTPDTDFEQNGVLVTEIGAGDDVLYDVVQEENLFAAAGFTTVGNSREFLLMTYENATVVGQRSTGLQSSNAWLQLSELQVEDSYAAYRESLDSGSLVVDVVTTEFGSGVDTATALTAVSSTAMVAVGFSTRTSQITKAAVAKYSLATSSTPLSTSSTLEDGSTYILTGAPYDVTRTTAIIPVEIFSGIGTVTQRGIVFNTAPNPVLKEESQSGSGGDSKAPVITNTTSQEFSSGSSVTLSLSTDEKATCKYNKSTDTTYSSMTNSFSGGDTTSHSADLGSSLSADSYTYYARCVDAAGNENSTGTAITFTVSASSDSTDSSAASTSFFDRTLQEVGDILVSPAFAAGSDTTNDSADATSDSNTTSEKDFVEQGYTEEGSGSGAFSARLENLKPGTFFYARAYAVAGGIVYYGNQVGFRTADSCFVATAAFGSIFHPYVCILREFRDSCLLDSHLGRSLVSCYYRYAPPVADLIASDSRLRFVSRLFLLPVVGAAWLALQLGLQGLFLLSAVAVFCWYLMRPTIISRVERE